MFRFFYEEVYVVKEERRQRNEDDPTGFLMERYLVEVYQVHPYGRPLIGSMEEIARYRTSDTWEFWETLYVPHRCILVMVDNLQPDKDLVIIEWYFGAVPARDWDNRWTFHRSRHKMASD